MKYKMAHKKTATDGWHLDAKKETVLTCAALQCSQPTDTYTQCKQPYIWCILQTAKAKESRTVAEIKKQNETQDLNRHNATDSLIIFIKLKQTDQK